MPNEGIVVTDATSWTLVEAAKESREALGELLARYEPQIKEWIRYRLRTSDSARVDDIAQSFFVGIIRRGSLLAVDRKNTRLRSWLYGSVEKHIRTQIRDGNRCFRNSVAFDPTDARGPISKQREDATLEALWDKRWALRLLSLAIEKLAQQDIALHHPERFKRVVGLVMVPKGEHVDYESLSTELGVLTGTLRQWVRKLRKNFEDLLHEEAKRTVKDCRDIDDELQTLRRALSSR